MAKLISVCIPVYNEAQNLPVAVSALEELFQKELAAYRLEIIVTDNASTDNTWEVAGQLAQARPNLKAYRFSRNFGYQNSIFAGLSMATGDAVVEMDADLEDPPHVIPEFVKKWEEGFDVAYGVRATRHTAWPLKFLFWCFYRFLNKISDLKIPENSGDFRLLDRKVVNVLKALPERNLYLRGLVSYLGYRQTAVVYHRQPRISGTSKFRFFHYVVLAVDAVTAFSKTPLRMIGALGWMLFIAASGMAIFYLLNYIRHGSGAAGFPTLIIVTLMLHSVSFIFLGVLGEYLSRIFDDSKYRPRVIIADAKNAPEFPATL
jgi:dolichol-phosphate mannosyltransferase